MICVIQINTNIGLYGFRDGGNPSVKVSSSQMTLVDIDLRAHRISNFSVAGIKSHS